MKAATKRTAAWLLVLVLTLGLLTGCASGTASPAQTEPPAGAEATAEPAAPSEAPVTADASVTDTTGVNYVERTGIGFSLNAGTALRTNDLIETKASSSAELALGGTALSLDEKTEIKLVSAAESASVELHTGEMLVQNAPGAVSEIAFFDRTLKLDGAALFWVRTGSAGVLVLRGTAETNGETLSSGESISYTESSADKSEPQAASLDEFSLTRLTAAVKSGAALCYTEEELTAVADARAEEKRLAVEAQNAHNAAVLAQGYDESADEETYDGPICTIEIRCDTILDNMENLTDGKNAYVPANGTILATSQVGFTEGETVFNVLQRVCAAAGIQLEYSWTPMYGSYYIEGINNLYEFDCGEQSGWMYKVNGWFPNYGCSSYTLKDGDTIVWCYTCNGLGADVGGSVY